MARPTRLDKGIEGWLKENKGWQREDQAVSKTFDLGTFPAAIGFVVQLSILAEKHDHHPDIDIRWKSVRVLWTTHDAGGLTRLDLVLAEATDALAR